MSQLVNCMIAGIKDLESDSLSKIDDDDYDYAKDRRIEYLGDVIWHFIFQVVEDEDEAHKIWNMLFKQK